ncbi:type 1 glutamine amidotransferase [Leucobacter massiliensis]|uniref:Glutamine amidotransferase domain-containing protein n=1 Tax=Leucobacter massiliensis TaxID=1686285 RepID=A0A2S9QPL2_9MICO|nr:type 1 glutamine amidotransferase [Leucobacter massiliensis]PRI11527.1 hypothetical protein B4915_06805 [Leucobacter massiliensis]
MGEPRVLVIEHQGNAGLGQLREPLSRAGLRIETAGPDAGVPVPGALDGYDALIVLGGAVGPLDDEQAPWLPATRALLAEAVDRAVPALGICLGAQLLATATGGHVREMPAGPEIGLCEVEFDGTAAEDRLFAPLAGERVPVMQWHYLEADALPAGARLLASSAACPHQAFRLGEAAWGVQFHPEAVGTQAVDWVEEDPEGLVRIGADAGSLVAAVRAAEPRLAKLWQGMAGRFAGIVRAEAARARPVR